MPTQIGPVFPNAIDIQDREAFALVRCQGTFGIKQDLGQPVRDLALGCKYLIFVEVRRCEDAAFALKAVGRNKGVLHGWAGHSLRSH